jgi:hypothetical protein
MVRDEDEDSSSQVNKQAKVLYRYIAREDDELNVEADLIVSILKMDEDDWWQCECDGEIGMLPANYLQVLDQDSLLENQEISRPLSPKQSPQKQSPYPMSQSNLPQDWKMFVDEESGDIYYHNELTGWASSSLYH